MRFLIHLIPFLSLFPALFSSLLALSQTTCSPHHTNDNDDNSSLCQLCLILFSLRIDGLAQKKKIQNLLTWCLSLVEGNDEAILSWSFYGLANNKDESEVFFRIKRSTKLQKLVDALCTTVPSILNH